MEVDPVAVDPAHSGVKLDYAKPSSSQTPAIKGREPRTKEPLKDDPPIVIDVRTTEEVEKGFIHGALHIPFQEIDQLEQRINSVLPKNTEILLYCRSGRRSGIAADALSELGFKKARNIGTMEDAREILMLRGWGTDSHVHGVYCTGGH